MTPTVIDRTRRATGKSALRYEVVIFHREIDLNQETGIVLAKFRHCGDAFLYAKTIVEPCCCVIVRN